MFSPDANLVSGLYLVMTCDAFSLLFLLGTKQILKTGFFHADPHPGNLAVDKDGSLIYYDFGMMGEIKQFTRERLLSLFYSVYEKDANKVLSWFFHENGMLAIFTFNLAFKKNWTCGVSSPRVLY